MADIMMKRRDAIKALLAISAASALAACTGENAKDKPTNSMSVKYASDGAFLDSEELALIAALAQTIIPKTETAGAVEAGVPQVLQALLSEWGDDNMRRYWRSELALLEQHFQIAGGQNFSKQSAAQRENLLSKYDADVFSGKTDSAFYKEFKSTAVTAYYMSEPGATEELAYEAVPGEWKGCVPLADYPKTWAT